jgi:hypothetical protein
MALQQIPGYSQYFAVKYSTLDKRTIGKFTDSNRLANIGGGPSEPAMYDKKIISLYTQTKMYANDFLQMINKSTPYFIDGNTESFQFKVNVPYRFPVVVDIPDSTMQMATPGIDGTTFQIVFDRKFPVNAVITSHLMYGQRYAIQQDPIQLATGWLHTCSLVTPNPLTDYVNFQWLKEGLEFQQVDQLAGEFSTRFGEPDLQGDSITLYDSLSAGYQISHSITDWADARQLKDEMGNAIDIVAYTQYGKDNKTGQMKALDMRWEPYAEMLCRQKMLDLKVKRMIWGTPGTFKEEGGRHEIVKATEGIYYKIRNNGNLVRYNRGEFNLGLIRDVFGDLFYRRVPMAERRVKIFTNETGIEILRQAFKQDLLNQGLVLNAGSNDKFIQGSGQNMVSRWGVDSVWTTETGLVTYSHLTELDLPETNTQFGQYKKSPPIFMVFDVTPQGDGTLTNNIREVRMRSRPSMTWGYKDGTISHNGFAASQGMISSSLDPWYTMWFKDRADTFIEDPTRCVIIEEIPQY